MSEEIVFFANGPARLLMSSVIADELFPDNRKQLILLRQFGYRYDELLPHVHGMFDQVHELHIQSAKYSHLDQLLNSYFNPFPHLRRIFHPGQRLILFGLRSPAQKFMIRMNKRLGNRIDVYAESVSVDRYFAARHKRPAWQAAGARLLSRAFDFQHDYDRFYVLDPSLYDESPHREKIAKMFNLFGSPSFRRYAALLTAHLDLSGLEGYDEVFLGQPLSNFASFLEPREEEEMLREIIADRKVLVLPHPNERLDAGRDKYRVLPNAQVFRGGVPSELVLLKLLPRRASTYYSTAGVNYAMMNPESRNSFYPIHRSMYEMLCRFRQSLPNMSVTDRYLVGDDPYLSPRSLKSPGGG